MRFTVRLMLAAGLVLVAACQKKHDDKRVTVLFTTDEHSHLFATAPELDDFDLAAGTVATATGSGALKGGVARRATILVAQRERARSRGVESLTVSSGDFSQGTLTNAAFLQTSPDLVLMEMMRYDAIALGNHEFELGPTGLARAIQIADGRLNGDLPPLLLTNMIGDGVAGTADDGLEGYAAAGKIARSRVVTRGGLKVGFVAWMGAGAGTDAAGAAPIRFWTTTASDTAAKLADIAAQVQPVVDQLRTTDRVDVVVALGHGGIDPGDDQALASMVSGIDLVVSGHSHKVPNEVRLVIGPEGRYVPIVQAGPYGEQIGRVELLVRDGGRAVLDPDETAFIAVDDRTAPTTDADILGELQGTIAMIESGFAPATLAVSGIPPASGPLGSLYYQDLCHTTFYARGLGGGESNVMDLDADAMLSTVNESGGPTTVALQNYGAIRSNLVVGQTGHLSFADLYRVVPNGVDPGTGTPGFPLVRVGIANVELRIALEGALLQSMLDGDYFLGASGLRIEYDKLRPLFDVAAAPTNPFTPGWITRIALTDAAGTETQLLYDVTQDGILIQGVPTHFLVNPTSVQPVATTYYVASFASAFGIHLYNLSTGDLLNPPAGPSTIYDAVVRWPANRPGVAGVGTAVKDHQSLLKYVYEQCQANGGQLPSRYDDALPAGHVPRRMVDCTGGVCP